MTRSNRTWLRPLALSLALLGCDKDEPLAPEPGAEVGLRRIQSCDDLRDRVEDTVVEALVQSRYGYGYPVLEGDGGAEGAPTDNAGGGDGPRGDEGPTDFTGTNNQEEGVDELDLVKTDGKFLYIAQDRGLQIVKSWPADDTALVGQLELEGWATGLFLVGDKLVVFESVSDTVNAGGPKESYFYGTRMLVVDVSDRAAPTVERTVDISGWISDARMVDGTVYYVVNQYMDLPAGAWDLAWREGLNLPEAPAWDAPDATWESVRAAARAVYRPEVEALLAGTNLNDWLPQWRTDGGDFSAMYACSDLYVPDQQTPLSMLGVGQLDPATGDVGSIGLLANGWTMYASAENLYVAQTSQWWWGWGDNSGESHIHKFALGGDTPTYVASGAVGGWLYDQFAMSEYDGHLRVVTTDLNTFGGGGVTDGGGDVPVDDGGTSEGGSDGSSGGSDPDAGEDTPAVNADDVATDTDVVVVEESEPEPEVPANNVFVLKDNGEGTLEQVGHVGGIAPGERVYAVRMMGEKGYVVTFRQTDPLYTVDLSNPTAPAVVGELKVPGYSAYLHPLGDDYLIGVGMSGTESGTLTGLEVSVFDVSDFANPTRLHAFQISENTSSEEGWSWSWSEALWDHHAFTYGRDTLTIPAFTEYYDQDTQTWDGFSGTISLHVAADGIEELGRVDHQPLVDESICLYDWWWTTTDVDGDVVEGDDGEEVPPDGGGGASEPGEDPAEPTDPAEPFSYCSYDYGYWYAQVRRSVYVEDKLYTISTYGVRVNELSDPSVSIADVVFYPPAE